MSYSFSQIEEKKSRVISLVFYALILFYFFIFWFIALLTKNYSLLETAGSYKQYIFSFLNFVETLNALLAAVVVGGGHWLLATHNLIAKILKVLNAQPPDREDQYHKRFVNIVDEVSIATGGRKIEPVVVPTMAMNAFALCDFHGRAIIGVTEGILSHLTRSQVEAIVGHEAAHIVSGDARETTVTAALFELYNGFLSGAARVLVSKDTGFSNVLIGLIYVLLFIGQRIALLFRMFISREREFRADAVAVRLTRDPLSLAEALYLISYHWRGGGIPVEEMASIFIVSPGYSALEEKEGMEADLFATHPPVQKRLKILLGMAHANEQTLADTFQQMQTRPRTTAPTTISVLPSQWKVYLNGIWQGPFDLMGLRQLTGFLPETWIKRCDSEDVTPAYSDSEVESIFSEQAPRVEAQKNCPHCHVPLRQILYEGLTILNCHYCGGVLVHEHNVDKIIMRQEMNFSPDVIRTAKQLQENWNEGCVPPIDLKAANLFVCPICPSPAPRMLRRFYTLVYPIEIDRCYACGYIWFGRDELEVLQYLIEQTQKNV